MTQARTFEHSSVIPPRLIRAVPPIDKIWLERYSEIPTTDIADKVGRLYTMEGIRPLFEPVPRAVGRAVTAKPWPGDGLAVHGAASLTEDGDILIVDQRGYLGVTGAGFRMLTGPRLRGLRGFIVDGALRDADEFQEVGFPVFARAHATHASTKRWPGEINVPISCGGVIVEPGDLVVADVGGVVVVPRVHVATVWHAIEGTASPELDAASVAVADARRREIFLDAFRSAGGLEAEWGDAGRR